MGVPRPATQSRSEIQAAPFQSWSRSIPVPNRKSVLQLLQLPAAFLTRTRQV